MTMPMLIQPLKAADAKQTEQEIIKARIRSRAKWRRRQFRLRVLALILGRRKDALRSEYRQTVPASLRAQHR